jgi:hypothetical protein
MAKPQPIMKIAALAFQHWQCQKLKNSYRFVVFTVDTNMMKKKSLPTFVKGNN